MAEIKCYVDYCIHNKERECELKIISIDSAIVGVAECEQFKEESDANA